MHLCKAGFHLLPQLFILSHNVEELAHDLVSFILQQLVAAFGRGQPAFELFELHTGGIDVDISHFPHPFSANSGLKYRF